MSMEEEKIEQDIKKILQPSVNEVLEEKPKEPVIKYNILLYRFYICFNGFIVIMI